MWAMTGESFTSAMLYTSAVARAPWPCSIRQLGRKFESCCRQFPSVQFLGGDKKLKHYLKHISCVMVIINKRAPIGANIKQKWGILLPRIEGIV